RHLQEPLQPVRFLLPPPHLGHQGPLRQGSRRGAGHAELPARGVDRRGGQRAQGGPLLPGRRRRPALPGVLRKAAPCTPSPPAWSPSWISSSASTSSPWTSPGASSPTTRRSPPR